MVTTSSPPSLSTTTNTNVVSNAVKKHRHSVLMDTSVKNFQRLLNSAGEFMRDEVENLPLRIYE